MPWLTLALFAPCLAILGGLYWWRPGWQRGDAPGRGFDLAAIALALAAGLVLAHALFVANEGVGPPVWRHVISSIGAYSAFLGILLAAAVGRAWIRRQAARRGASAKPSK